MPTTRTASTPHHDAATETEAALLSFDRQTFAECFGRTPFLIEHRLSGHSLFGLERLLELSRSLPESCIEYNAGDLPLSIDLSRTPRNGLSVEETIRRIESCRSWMVLKYVDRDEAYRGLLEECLSLVRPHSEPIAAGMTSAQAFIFITSPGSVTPYHIDPEHNFLLQVRGSKTVRMLDGSDRDVLSDRELEGFYADQGRNLEFDESNQESGWKFLLEPGMGLHFPVTYPHWVQNGPDVSVSFSITFRTPDLDRRQALYRTNARLRGLGLNPSAPGTSAWRDAVKFQSYRVLRRLLRR